MRLALYRKVFLFYFACVADADVSVNDRPQVFVKPPMQVVFLGFSAIVGFFFVFATLFALSGGL
jgi:hypothetical protein